MITKTILELEKLFNSLNKEFFDDKLIKPVILVQSKKKKNTLGTCSVNPIWEKKDKEDDKRYEITLSAEYLNRPIEEILATLLHEMVHLYCSLKNIKDTSNNYVYHNKRFKEEAECRGLIITKAPTIGWSVTELKPETIKLINKFKIDDTAFDYFRNITILVASKKIVLNKYECPGCAMKLSHYKKLNLICGDCKKPLEIKE